MDALLVQDRDDPWIKGRRNRFPSRETPQLIKTQHFRGFLRFQLSNAPRFRCHRAFGSIHFAKSEALTPSGHSCGSKQIAPNCFHSQPCTENDDPGHCHATASMHALPCHHVPGPSCQGSKIIHISISTLDQNISGLVSQIAVYIHHSLQCTNFKREILNFTGASQLWRTPNGSRTSGLIPACRSDVRASKHLWRRCLHHAEISARSVCLT